MKNVLVLIGACCHNRGSEALVRGTISIIKKYIPDSRITLSGAEEKFGPYLKYAYVDKYVRRFSFYGGFSVKRCAYILFSKIFCTKNILNKIKYSGLIKAGKKADLIIIIGGDNYDRTYTSFSYMHEVNLILRKVSKAKMVMYDCSLAPEEIDKDIIKDFSLFDAITAREIITYNAFTEHFPNEKLFYFPDPAFVMEPKAIDLPDGFAQDKTIGVNLSTLVLGEKYGDKSELVLQSYINIIKYILDNTECHVLLIPHVMMGKDLNVLREIKNKFLEEKRIILIENENYTAPELKYLISKCRMFIGARTHSTIAAYSSCVPTLVLGYSVKSLGIARDLFGKEDGYVISVQTLNDDFYITNVFAGIIEDEYAIREQLQCIIPGYINNAWQAGGLFKGLLGDEING